MTDIEALLLSFICGFAAMAISSYSRWQKQLAINEGFNRRIQDLEYANRILRELRNDDYEWGHSAPGETI